jgi:hypothetical protein
MQHSGRCVCAQSGQDNTCSRVLACHLNCARPTAALPAGNLDTLQDGISVEEVVHPKVICMLQPRECSDRRDHLNCGLCKMLGTRRIVCLSTTAA